MVNARVIAGGTAVITGNSTTTQYLHKDWIGNARIVSNSSHVVSSDQAYTPYGEMYAVQTGASTYFDWFAGMSGNFNNGVLFDTPNREFAQSDQGRFLSPDPAGSGWNQYAYPANPNSESDPSGLIPYFQPRIMAREWNGWKNVLTEYGGGGYGAMAEASVAADAFDEAAARTIARANKQKAQNKSSGGFWQKLGNALSGHGWKSNADVAEDPTQVSVVGAKTSDYRGAGAAKGVLNQFHSVVTGMDKSGMRRTGSGEANGEMNDAQHWTNGYMGCQDQAYMAQALLSDQHNGYQFVVQGEDPDPLLGGAYHNYEVVGLPDNPGNPTLFLSPWLNSATVVVPPQ
jgi:RHS repeat-associated protein